MNRILSVLGTTFVLTATAQSARAAETAGAYSLREDLSFWGIIYFVLFLWVCKKLLWDWWQRSMGERERAEASRIAAAEAANRQAAELLSDRLGRMEAV